MIHETYLYGQVSNTVGPITMGKGGRQMSPSFVRATLTRKIRARY